MNPSRLRPIVFRATFSQMLTDHYVESVLAKCEALKNSGIWPAEPHIRPEAWLSDEVLKSIIAYADQPLIEWARGVPKSQLYFVKYWAEAGHGSMPELAESWREDPAVWSTRLGNYGYASLFWLSRGRKGARIRKYYSGARTMLGLASGNIRYFIQLADEALGALVADKDAAERWDGSIPPMYQTLGARAVGKRRLDQLESTSEHGADIKRLVLALGKVFFEFARDPVGRAPETNSFVVTGSEEAGRRVRTLLYEGVSILAFEVTPRTKATSRREMRDDEFRLHPIFAPFFEYSHRRKRRSAFPAEVLLEVLENPARALSAMLGRPATSIEELPRQLAMFSEFYQAGDDSDDETS